MVGYPCAGFLRLGVAGFYLSYFCQPDGLLDVAALGLEEQRVGLCFVGRGPILVALGKRAVSCSRSPFGFASVDLSFFSFGGRATVWIVGVYDKAGHARPQSWKVPVEMLPEVM